MVECCGKDRDSRFCPDCGNKLRQEPLTDLLAHCEQHQALVARQLEHQVARLVDQDDRVPPAGRASKNLERIKRVHVKWTSWVEALRKVTQE